VEAYAWVLPCVIFTLLIFVAPSALIALAPFRYLWELWNNPPKFVEKSSCLAFLTPVMVDIVVTLALSYLMMVCRGLWKLNTTQMELAYAKTKPHFHKLLVFLQLARKASIR
jgi:hypothetical protein